MGTCRHVVHGLLLLATITKRWLGETPFVQVSTTWALTRPETEGDWARGRLYSSCSRSYQQKHHHDSRQTLLHQNNLSIYYSSVDHGDSTNSPRYTHTHPFNGPFSETTRVGWYKKGKTNLDFTEARDSEWQWYQLGRMQVCTSLQTDNHASTPPLSFLQAGCPSCCPTNSVKALKAVLTANQQI